MRFNRHPELEGRHAFLSASKYHWLRYSPEKLLERFDTAMTAALGTQLHEYAATAVKLGRKQPNTSETINLYVNDCIGHRMEVEVPLYYSRNAFGTADAIRFETDPIDGKRVLRIFDLKNGVIEAKEDQLEIYAAFFCLEYKVKPMTIKYDLRIYQNDSIKYFETDPQDIAEIMELIKAYDKLIEEAREEV